jgi:tetratricopeptide (TPR) repeat protein
MPEGLLGGILSDDDDKPEVETPEALATAEAFAAAVAARLSGGDPEVARDTSAVLREQTQLLKVQKEHLEDEHTLRLAHLRYQAELLHGQRFGQRLRTAFQVFFALVATVIGLGFAVMIRDAVSSRSVVVDSIEVAPNIDAQVPSGRILSAGLLDVLTRIQAATRSNAEHRALSNAWTSEISVDIPETGVSIAQLGRMLKNRFGHDQHIDGDLVASGKGGLALTVRGSGIMPSTFTDAGGNLGKLLTQAGEYLYSQSQPGLWTAYLNNNGRRDEAIRFAQGAYATVAASEKPFVLNYWANAISGNGGEGAMAEALTLWRETIRLKPDYWTGYNNIMVGLGGIGDEEGMVRVGLQMMQVAGGRPGKAPDNLYQNYDQEVWDLPALRASNIADIEASGGVGTTTAAAGAAGLTVAGIEVQLHDLEAAALRLKTTPIDEKNVADVASQAYARALLTEEQGDLKAAALQWDAYAAAYADPTVATLNSQGICYAAVTYEKTGQPAKAQAALDAPQKAVGIGTFVDCYRFRGDVLDLRGDWSGAQEWYAKTVKLAPSLPAGYYSWGLALARHGDLAGAAAKFQLANQKGPHWSDPLKAWGDVLVKQNNAKDALAKYEQSLRYAPNWKQLKEAREAAAKLKT